MYTYNNQHKGQDWEQRSHLLWHLPVFIES